MKLLTKSLMASLMLVSLSASALQINSTDIQEGTPMAKTFEYAGWGCKGDNISPELSWKDAPKGTKSFAITAFDPDAPTMSGFWHWIAFNIPASVSKLPQGVDMTKLGATVARNDYGSHSFGGACPPAGDGMHRYKFTVWALPVAKLDLNKDTPAAVIGFTLNSIALAKSTLTATFTHK